MPLISTKNLGPKCRVIIWKIEESADELREKIILHPSDSEKFAGINNEEKQREFLAVRCCLASIFGVNPAVVYSKNGKPHVEGPVHISFSHTRGFAGMIISEHRRVGIDLEVKRPGFARIAPKFMSENDWKGISADTELEQLIHYWGAKEVMVKITGNRRLNFKQNLRVAPFRYQPQGETTGVVITDDYQLPVQFSFDCIENLHLTYGWENHPCRNVTFGR